MMDTIRDLWFFMHPLNGLRALAVPALLPYVAVFAGFIGACIGSFLTLATYRLPLDEEIGTTRSCCPKCHKKLKLWDLVPLLSWCFSRGRCRYCKAPVSVRYPLIELASALGTALIVWHYTVSWEALMVSGLWWCIVAIFVTDLEYTIILDEVQIATAVFGIGYAVVLEREAETVAGAAIIGGLIGLTLKYGFIYLRNKDGLGLGDVKFLVVAGIWLGVAANFVPFLFFSGLMGILSGLIFRALGHGERFPFGPSLAMALLICVIFPQTADGFWKLYGLLH